MYNVYNENDEKVFGCSSLSTVINYITEIGVDTVVTGTKVRINLTSGEHVEINFGCSTVAHDWIMRHVPGKPVEIVSKKGGCVYRYK